MSLPTIDTKHPTPGLFVHRSLQTVLFRRGLDDFEVDMYGGDGDGMMDSSPLDGLFDEATLEKVDECGVDLNEIMDDYIGAMMDASMMDNDEDKVAFFLDFMDQLAEEGEENCTEEQVAQYQDASSDFLKCTGMFHTLQCFTSLV